MEIYVVENIYKLMILMRADIKNPHNKEICELILHILNMGGSNSVFTEKLSQIIDRDKYSNFFYADKCEYVNIENRIKYIFICCVEKIKDSLNKENFALAYDLVDSFHGLPEMVADDKKINMRSYWNTYFKNLEKKYGKEELKSLKKYFTKGNFTL